MPIFSSHLIADLMSARRPSSSKQTIPISSVTLAWRTLVMTLNFWLSSQITGLVIIRGGYISQSRLFCGAPSLPARAGPDFFLTLAGMKQRIGDWGFAIGDVAVLHPPAMAGMMLISSPSLTWVC